MIDLQQKLQANILDRLKRRKNQRLTRREFEKAIEAIEKQLQTDPDAIQQGVEALLREEYVSRTVRGTYQLEKKGADHLAQIVPAAVELPPEINEALIPYQKAFVLMHLFCAKQEKTLTRSELFAKLKQPAVVESGLFLRLSTDPPVNPDLPTVEWIIAQLVRGGNTQERKSGQGARYWLTEHGQELLAVTDLPKSIEFTLSGQQLNELREAARHAGHLDIPIQEPRPETLVVEPTAPTPAPSVLTFDMVLSAFEDLRGERFARNGIVPVYELRRLLIARHGPEAGSHAALDPLVKQMRREKRLRLIAISDLAGATTDQLDDSVPGESETFFYLEAAHEYANAR